MRGYVERMEWLEKCSDGPVGYDEIMDSFRNDADSLDVDRPRPERGLCQRCLRTMPITKLEDRTCIDRRSCSKALLRLRTYMKGLRDG